MQAIRANSVTKISFVVHCRCLRRRGNLTTLPCGLYQILHALATLLFLSLTRSERKALLVILRKPLTASTSLPTAPFEVATSMESSATLRCLRTFSELPLMRSSEL